MVEEWVALATRAKAGDVEAFSRLVDRFKLPLCAAIHPMVKDWHVTQDLAQDVFVAAFEGLPELRDPGRFRAWIFTIARNRAFSAIRREALVDETCLEQAEEGEIRSLPRGAGCRINAALENGRLSAAAARRLRRAILALPNDYGTMLVLRHVEEMSIPEISEVLNRTPRSIKAALYRARMQARSMLLDLGLTMERMLNEL